MPSRPRTDRRTRSHCARRYRPGLEHLEIRLAPAGLPVAGSLTPEQIVAAYGLNQVTFGSAAGTGAGQTVAIVEAYDDPKLVDLKAGSPGTSDLDVFDKEFNLATPNFTKLNEYGSDIGSTGSTNPLPTTDPVGAGQSDAAGSGVPSGNWESQTILAVEWVHAVAPGANIDLIECNTASIADMLTGLTTAAGLSGVSVVLTTWSIPVSNSLAIPADDSVFTTPSGHQGVTFVAPTGDSATTPTYPAVSPNVLAVGGTQLALTQAGAYSAETAWSMSNHGSNSSEAIPSYQSGVQTTADRMAPDVSFSAVGMAVYDSYNGSDWASVSSTSLAAASWAGIVSIADQGAVANAGNALEGVSATLPALYGSLLGNGDLHPIATGNTTGIVSNSGFDGTTGLGSPGTSLVGDLAAYGEPSSIALSYSPQLQANSQITAGASIDVTATVQNVFGKTAGSYDGSVTLEIQSTTYAPGSLTPTISTTTFGPEPANDGVATFVTGPLTVAGTYVFIVKSGSVTDQSFSFSVVSGAFSHLAFTGVPSSSLSAGQPFSPLISGVDTYGNVVSSFTQGLTVSLVPLLGSSGTLSGSSFTATASSGTATFPLFSITAPGSYELQTTFASVTYTSSIISVIASSAANITVSPIVNAIAGNSFAVNVALLDAYFGFATVLEPVTLSLSGGPTGSQLLGTLTLSTSSGIADFTGLSIDTPGSGYVIKATSGSVTGASSSFTVGAAPGTQLAFSSNNPATVAAGSSFSLGVLAEDALGNPGLSSDALTLTLTAAPAGVAVGQTYTGTLVNGSVSVPVIALTTAGTYTFEASVAGNLLSSATSSVVVASSEQPLGFSPQQIQSAYGVNQITYGSVAGTGAGQTIAIVAPYDDPNLSDSTSGAYLGSDLVKFDEAFAIANPSSFTKLNQYGADVGANSLTAPPPTDPAGAGNVSGNWERTEAMAVEWAHAMAPGAAIVLIETDSASLHDLLLGLSVASNLSGVSVVLTDWTLSENAGETQLDDAFTTPASHQGITYVAPTGNSVAQAVYPAASPNVLSVGGTALTLTPLGAYSSETAWAGTGGGLSQYEAEPQYQTGLPQSQTQRMTPDVSFNATLFPVYDTYNDSTGDGPWFQIDSTSISAACWAGLIAIGNQGRASKGGTPLDGPSETLPVLYGIVPPSDFHDISSGTNGTHSAGPGYDLVSGLGTPVANLVVQALATYQIASQIVITSFVPAGPLLAGETFSISASVKDGLGEPMPSFDGLISVSIVGSSATNDLQGVTTLPASGGLVSFSSLALDTSALNGVTLQLTSPGLSAATTSSIVVSPEVSAGLSLAAEPTVTAGTTFGVGINVQDIYGNIVGSSTDAITLSFVAGPTGATLPASVTSDAVSGSASFAGYVLDTAGTYSLIASDGLLNPLAFTLTVATGAATHVAIVGGPPEASTGQAFSVVVAIEDAYGNIVNSTDTISLSFTGGPNGGTLNAPLTSKAVAGIATFNEAALDTSGFYSVQANDGSLTALDTTITVTPAASKLVLTAVPTTTITAGNPFGLSVALEDAFGNIVSLYSGAIELTLSGGNGGAALGGVSSTTASGGEASFSNLTLTTPATYTIEAIAPGLSLTTSASVTVAAGVATQLAFTVPPSAQVNEQGLFSLTVSAEDAYGNLATSFNGVVTISLATNPVEGDLIGTLVANASQGVATFSGLSFDTPGSGYSIASVAAGLTSAVTGPITVETVPVPRVAVTAGAPASVELGQYFQITVAAENANGSVDAGFNSLVTLTLVGGPDLHALGGTLTMPAQNGLVTFYALRLNDLGDGYTIRVSAPGLASTFTSAIHVARNPANDRIELAKVLSTSVTVNTAFGLTITLPGSIGGLDTEYRGVLSVSLVGAKRGVKLIGPLTTQVADGTATFSGLSINKTGKRVRLKITGEGLAPFETAPFNVVPAPKVSHHAAARGLAARSIRFGRKG